MRTLLALALAGCASSPVTDLRVDHVIVGVSALDSGIEQFEALTSVRPEIGGEHPGRGTHNALVSVAPQTYVEILAPVAGAELPDDRQPLTGYSELTPYAFAVGTDDVHALRNTLKLHGYQTTRVEAGSRVRPDGSTLEWETVRITAPPLVGTPFFIGWSESSPHPATTSPGGAELRALEVTTPDAVGLKNLFEILELDSVTVRPGDELGVRLTLATPAGQVRIGRD